MKPYKDIVAHIFTCCVRNRRGCLIWQRSLLDGRFPAVKHKQRTLRCSRLVLERKLGRELRVGMQALHTCDVMLCLEPLHLYEGTQEQNVIDREERKRGAKGEQVGTAKLDRRLIRQIRGMGGGHTQQEVADMFGISQGHVSRIMRRLSWAHLKR